MPSDKSNSSQLGTFPIKDKTAHLIFVTLFLYLGDIMRIGAMAY